MKHKDGKRRTSKYFLNLDWLARVLTFLSQYHSTYLGKWLQNQSRPTFNLLTESELL